MDVISIAKQVAAKGYALSRTRDGDRIVLRPVAPGDTRSVLVFVNQTHLSNWLEGRDVDLTNSQFRDLTISLIH